MPESPEERYQKDRFWDMELRVINARGPDFRIEFRNPGGCWPYGPLFLYEESSQRWALLGDLRISVTIEETLRLIEIAELCRSGIVPQLDRERSDLSQHWAHL